MATFANTSNFGPILKEHYSDKIIHNLAKQNTPLLGLMKTKYYESVGGSKFVQPIAYALPGGGSSTFATANAAANNESKFGRFEVSHVPHYRIVRVGNELISRTSTGSEDAFERAMDEFDRGIMAEGQYINHRMYRSWGGAIGVTSAISTTDITFTDPSDVLPLRAGDVLRCSANDGRTGSLRAGSVTVASVNRRTGVVTCTGNVASGITSPVAGDYFFCDGDFGLGISGLKDYIAESDGDAATTLNGLTRANDIAMLGGCRVDGTAGASIADVAVDMVTEYMNMSGPSQELTMLINTRVAGQLTKQLEGKWEIAKAGTVNGKNIADIGYSTWVVNLEGRRVNFVTDVSCPTKRMFLLDMPTWCFFSAKSAPRFLLQEGGHGIIKPSEGDDAWESRIGWYGNMVTNAPGYNVVGLLP